MSKYNCPTCNKPCESPDGCFAHKAKQSLKSSGLRRTGKLKQRKKSAEEIEENRVEINKMWEFFELLWDKSDKICKACGKQIYGPNLSVYHDHLLPKHLFPKLKYEEENMFFCCFDCHSMKEGGFGRPLHLEAINKAKIRFGLT